MLFARSIGRCQLTTCRWCFQLSQRFRPKARSSTSQSATSAWSNSQLLWKQVSNRALPMLMYFYDRPFECQVLGADCRSFGCPRLTRGIKAGRGRPRATRGTWHYMISQPEREIGRRRYLNQYRYHRRTSESLQQFYQCASPRPDLLKTVHCLYFCCLSRITSCYGYRPPTRKDFVVIHKRHSMGYPWLCFPSVNDNKMRIGKIHQGIKATLRSCQCWQTVTDVIEVTDHTSQRISHVSMQSLQISIRNQSQALFATSINSRWRWRWSSFV